MWLLHLNVFFLISLARAGRMPSGARELLCKMNRDVDPCEDFYEFACGKYIENAQIPEYAHTKAVFYDVIRLTRKRVAAVLRKPIRRSDIEPIKKAKIFYQSCLKADYAADQVAIATALEYLNKETKWPTFDLDWNEADFDLERSMAEAQRFNTWDLSGFALGPFIQIRVVKDLVGEEYRPWFVIPNFLVSTQLLSLPGIIPELESLIADTLIILGADRDTAEADAKDILEFELKLQQAPWGYLDRFPISAIPGLLPYFDWYKFLNEAFRETDYTVADDDIVIFDTLYYPYLESVLQTTSKRTMINDIKWRMFTLMVPAMPDKIRERFLRIDTLLKGVQELPGRVEHCATVVNSEREYLPSIYGMTQTVGRMFVDKYVSKAHKAETDKMIPAVVDATIKVLLETDWLSEASRNALITKLNAYRHDVTYPNNTCDDQYLTNWYRDFNIRKENTFLENFISSVEGNVRRELEELLVHDVRRWRISPTIANAYSYYYALHVVVSAAIAQPPFFDLSFPKAVNWAGFGFMLAHETGHIISPTTQFFDAMGNLNFDGILSTETTERSEDILACFVDQYSQYEIPFSGGQKINGARTLDENLCDVIGVLIGNRAYRELTGKKGRENIQTLPFTAEQLYFISYAQFFCEKRRPEITQSLALVNIYSPGKFRSLGPLRNSPEFAEAFSCPVGSYMNPEEKCSIFG